MHKLTSHSYSSRVSANLVWGRGSQQGGAWGKAASVPLFLCAGLRNRHWGHHCKKGSKEAAAMQNLPVVPGQCVSRDADVFRHHCLWSGKQPASQGFHLDASREQNQKKMQ